MARITLRSGTNVLINIGIDYVPSIVSRIQVKYRKGNAVLTRANLKM